MGACYSCNGCGKCIAWIEEAAAKCPRCGEPLEPEQATCPTCGARRPPLPNAPGVSHQQMAPKT